MVNNQKYNQRNIILLGAVSFLNDIASKIILPILPLFIKEIGGGGIAIGLVSGVGESIASLFKMLAGFLSDKFGKRKPFGFIGYLISAISKLFFAFTHSWPQVLFLRSCERFGKGIRSAPRDAILAVSSPKEKRGENFGIHRAMDSGGAVLGAIIAFVLFWYMGFGFRKIFLVAGIFAFLALLPLIFVKEKKQESKEISLKIGLKNLPKNLRIFIIIATLFALGNFSYMFFVLKSQDYFSGKFAIGIPILLYILYNTSYTLFAVPAGILSDKIGRRKVLLLGYALFGLVCLGFVFAKSITMFVLLFIIFGLNYALVNANQRAFVSDLSKEDFRGTALGTFHMAISLATLPAGLIAGVLFDLNPVFPFIYGTIISLLTVILLLFL